MTKDEALKRAFNAAYDVRRDWRKFNATFLASLRESGWTLAPVEATKAMGDYAELIRALIQPTGPTNKAGKDAANVIATLTRERDEWKKKAGVWLNATADEKLKVQQLESDLKHVQGSDVGMMKIMQKAYEDRDAAIARAKESEEETLRNREWARAAEASCLADRANLADALNANRISGEEADERIAELEARAEAAERKLAMARQIDFLGLALELETQAKRVESQSVERAMSAAARGLRLALTELEKADG
jgi:hypothetical protein